MESLLKKYKIRHVRITADRKSSILGIQHDYSASVRFPDSQVVLGTGETIKDAVKNAIVRRLGKAV